MKQIFFFIAMVLIVLILTFLTNVPDYDLWARLAVGSIFFQIGHVLKQDIFSYLPTKALWIDHEWGSSVVFYFFVRYFGEWGLFALKAFILFAIFLLIVKIIKLQTDNNISGIFYFILLGFSLLPGIANLLRCQMFTYLFFTLWIYVLEKIRREDNKLIWILPLTMILWVNMHGGFLAGIGLVIIYTVGELLNRKNYLKYVGSLALIIPVTLMNPYGLKLWEFIVDASLMPRPYISEWAPISINGPFHIIAGIKIYIYSGFFFFCFLTISAWSKLFFQKEKPDWTKFILFIVLLYLGLRHQRHTEFFVLAVPALFYNQYVKLFEPIQILIKENLPEKAFKTWSTIRYCFGYVVLVVIFSYMLPYLSARIIIDPLRYPVGSFEFIKQNNISGNLATTFNWGSYAFWKLYPQCKVLIDGRYEEVYPDEIFHMARNFSENKGNGHEILKKYKADVLVLSKNKYSPEDVLLFTDWKLVYQDVSSILLLPSERIKPLYVYPDYHHPAYLKENLSKKANLN